MINSRERQLEETLSILGFTNALRALDLVKSEMCIEKGFKRYDGSHFYYHCVDVAQELLNFGIRDEDIIVAALLHDIVEDVKGFTVKMIEEKFNSNVATMVDLVSKKPDVNYKITENMEKYLYDISNNIGAALIKTADRMNNFGTLKDAPLKQRMKQALETSTFFIPFFKKCRNKYPRYSRIFVKAKIQTSPLIYEIEDHDRDVTALENKIKYLESKLKEAQAMGLFIDTNIPSKGIDK